MVKNQDIACKNESQSGSSDNLSDDPAMLLLAAACLSIADSLLNGVHFIVFISAVFFAFYGWDIASDVVGWRKSIWILAAMLGAFLVIRLLSVSIPAMATGK